MKWRRSAGKGGLVPVLGSHLIRRLTATPSAARGRRSLARPCEGVLEEKASPIVFSFLPSLPPSKSAILANFCHPPFEGRHDPQGEASAILLKLKNPPAGNVPVSGFFCVGWIFLPKFGGYAWYSLANARKAGRERSIISVETQ